MPFYKETRHTKRSSSIPKEVSNSICFKLKTEAGFIVKRIINPSNS